MLGWQRCGWIVSLLSSQSSTLLHQCHQQYPRHFERSRKVLQRGFLPCISPTATTTIRLHSSGTASYSSWREAHNETMENSMTPTSPTMNSPEPSRLSRRVCEKCGGQGKKAKPLSKKARMRYKRSLERQEQQQASSSSSPSETLQKPQPIWQPCAVCDGTGLLLRDSADKAETSSLSSECHQSTSSSLPSVAIVGGGISGFCLASTQQRSDK